MNRNEYPMMEALEGRLLLDATIWLITGPDTGTVEQPDGTVTAFSESSLQGDAGDDVFVLANDQASISGQIDGRGGNDQLIYAPTDPGEYDPSGTAGVSGPISVHLGTGSATATGGIVSIEVIEAAGAGNTLTGADAGGQWLLGPSWSGVAPGLNNFAGFDTLVGSDGPDVFVAGSALDGYDVSGGAGADGLEANVGTSSAEWTIDGPGQGQLAVAGEVLDFDGIETLTGSQGLDTFHLADGGDVEHLAGGDGKNLIDASSLDGAREWRLTGSDQGRLEDGPTFEQVGTIRSGSGGDRAIFEAGGRLSGGLEMGEGSDVLDYSLRPSPGGVTVNLGDQSATDIDEGWTSVEGFVGSEGSDELIGPDAPAEWTISAGGPGRVVDDVASSFLSFERLTGGSQRDQFHLADASKVSGGIDGGDGQDQLDLSAFDADLQAQLTGPGSGQVLGLIGVVPFEGMESLVGGTGNDLFEFTPAGQLTGGLDGSEGSDTVDLSAESDALAWRVTGAGAGEVDRPTGGTLGFAGVESIVSGGGDDEVAFQAGGTLDGSVDGGDGTDRLDVGGWSMDVDWSIDQVGGGSLSAGMAFAGIENVAGAQGEDRFAIQPGGSLAGQVDGGPGQDLLDYSDLDAGVTVDLPAGSADGTGGFSAIEGAIGSSGTDTLIGPEAGAVWSLEADGTGQLSNGIDFSFAEIEQLVGGTGADQLSVADGAPLASFDGVGGDDTADWSAWPGELVWSIDSPFEARVMAGGSETQLSNMRSLLSGAGDDQFQLADGARVDHLHGGGGTDRLDAMSYTTPTLLDLTGESDGQIETDGGVIEFTSIEDVELPSTSTVADSVVDLVASIDPHAIFERITPDERGLVWVTITNQGNAMVRDRVAVDLYASADGELDDGDLHLGGFSALPLVLQPGQSRTVRMVVRMPGDVLPGEYVMLGEVDGGDAVDELSESNNVAAAETPLNVVWEFGDVSGRRNVRLTIPDANGTPVTFLLRGGGTGAVVGGSDLSEIVLTGTTSRSVLAVVSRGNDPAVTVGGITADGDVRGIIGRRLDLAGPAEIQGSLGVLLLRDVLPGASIDVQGSEQHLARAIFSSVREADLSAAGGIGVMVLNEWLDQDGTTDMIEAPWLLRLVARGGRDNPRTPEVDESSNGDFQASMDLSGENAPRFTLGRTVVVGDQTGQWNIVGSAIAVVVRGTAVGARIQATEDIYNVVLGASVSTDILAGVRSDYTGRFADGPDAFVDGADSEARLYRLIVRGWPVSGEAPDFVVDSRYSAAELGAAVLTNAPEASDHQLYVLGGLESITAVVYRDTNEPGDNWSWRVGGEAPEPLTASLTDPSA